MSQKNETAVLILSLIITIGLAGAGIWWLTNRSGTNFGGLSPDNQALSNKSPQSQQSIEQRLSGGNKLLISGGSTAKKQEAVAAIASGNYNAAIANLETSLQANRNDPEALIYLNNARIGDRKSYTIATSMRLSKFCGASPKLKMKSTKVAALTVLH